MSSGVSAGVSRTGPVIAIDGPAGSGKSTLGRGLASLLDLPYINTGSMYRALTAAVLNAGLDPDDADAVLVHLQGMRFTLSAETPSELLIDGVEPGPELQAEDVEHAVSQVSRHPAARAEMAAIQRGLGGNGAVMEGRDIASVIFPDADLKIFLQADPTERAARRIAERAGSDEARLAEELARRDERDALTNPFVPPEGSIVVDTTGRDAEDVLHLVIELARESLA